MKSASGGLVVALAWLVVAMVPNAGATDYIVGDASPGWAIGYNYTTWTAGKTFVIGDNLIFKYNQPSHDVMEVTLANYDSCTSAGSISQKQTGNDIIPLTTEGTRYFICGIPSHCSLQMKITITTTAATTTPSPPSTTPTTPTTPPTPPSTTPKPPPTSSLAPPTSPGTSTPPPSSPPSPSDASFSLLPKALTPLFFAFTSLLLSFLSTL